MSDPADAPTLKIGYRQVLFATDLSNASEQRLIEAVRIARRDGAQLHLLHVVIGTRRHAGDAHEKDSWDHAPVRNRTAMELLGRDIQAHHPATVARVWRDKSIAAGILNYAQRHNVDLIVMGAGKRGRLRETLLGSIVQAIVSRSPVTVLVPIGRIGTRRGMLVPVDFSPESGRALAHASMLAARQKQRLVAVHAAKGDQGEAAKQLEKFVSRLPMWVPPRCVVVTGSAPEAVLAAAREFRSELIVVGSTCPAAGGRAGKGGFVAQLLRLSQLPLLVHRRPPKAEK